MGIMLKKLTKTANSLLGYIALLWQLASFCKRTQTDVSVRVPNQSENGEYNLNSIWFNKISKRFLCVCDWLTVKVIKVFSVTSPEKSFLNLANSNRSRIVITIFNDWFGSKRKSVWCAKTSPLPYIYAATKDHHPRHCTLVTVTFNHTNIWL